MGVEGARGAVREGLKLTPRQRLFCLEYLACLNATEAYRRAGYSAKNADVSGPALLQHLAVKTFLTPRLKERTARLELNAARLDEELARLAFADIGEVEDPATGQLFGSLRAIPEDTRRAVQSVKVRIAKILRGPKAEAAAAGLGIGDDPAGRTVEQVSLGTLEVKLAPKTEAIMGANKVLGRLKEKIEMTTKLNHEQLLLLAQKVREKRLVAAKAKGLTGAAALKWAREEAARAAQERERASKAGG